MTKLFKHRLRQWRTVELVRWAEYKEVHKGPYPHPLRMGFMVNAHGVEAANFTAPPHTVGAAYKQAQAKFDEIVQLWKEGGFND